MLFHFQGEATNLNLAHMMGYDCTDVEDLTKAEMEGREQAMHALTVSEDRKEANTPSNHRTLRP